LSAASWRGEASGPGGSRTLTVTGRLQFSLHCCNVPLHLPPGPRSTLRFRWITSQGTLAGRLDNRILRRPHGRWVWDGPGRVTSATGALGRYRHRSVGSAGETGA
jgi:hypothetical protein